MNIFVNGDLIENNVQSDTPKDAIFSHMRELFGDDAKIEIKLTDAEIAVQQTQAARKAIYSAQSAAEGKPVDAESNLGTTADGASLALTAVLIHTVATAESNGDFGAYQAAFMAQMAALESSGNADNVVAAAKELLTKMANREILMPFAVKGLGEVIQDVATRGHAATIAIAKVRKQQRMQAIIDATRQIVESGDAESLTTDRMPKVASLKSMLDFDINEADRDAAFAQAYPKP